MRKAVIDSVEREQDGKRHADDADECDQRADDAVIAGADKHCQIDHVRPWYRLANGHDLGELF